MSNFAFPHSVFKRHVLQAHKNQALFGKGLCKTNFSTISMFQRLSPLGCGPNDDFILEKVRKHWEREKILVASIFHPAFSSFLTVFSQDFFLKLVNLWVVLEKVNPFPKKPWILRVCSISLFENNVGKEQFLLFPHCFLLFWRNFCYFR